MADTIHPHPLMSLLSAIGWAGSLILSYFISNIYVTDIRVWTLWMFGMASAFVGIVANWKSFQKNFSTFEVSIKKVIKRLFKIK